MENVDFKQEEGQELRCSEPTCHAADPSKAKLACPGARAHRGTRTVSICFLFTLNILLWKNLNISQK